MRCREYQGSRTADGYGRRGKPSVYLHRWVWEQINGPIPPGMEVMHSCDNPPCFLYEHLRLGTHAENVADMNAKGRGRPGRRKLSATRVDEIRQALTAGEVQWVIASRYGVDPSAISNIHTGKSWRHHGDGV